jgi:hypothetical protein
VPLEKLSTDLKHTRIVSPTHHNYIFYQYDEAYGYKITRLGYTVALNRLDGVYYVDPRPEMLVNERLREQIGDFQQFLVEDLWKLSAG